MSTSTIPQQMRSFFSKVLATLNEMDASDTLSEEYTFKGPLTSDDLFTLKTGFHKMKSAVKGTIWEIFTAIEVKDGVHTVTVEVSQRQDDLDDLRDVVSDIIDEL
jgi:hypothetical protein